MQTHHITEFPSAVAIHTGELPASATIHEVSMAQLRATHPHTADIVDTLQYGGADVYLSTENPAVFMKVLPAIIPDESEIDAILDECSRELGFTSFKDYLASKGA